MPSWQIHLLGLPAPLLCPWCQSRNTPCSPSARHSGSGSHTFPFNHCCDLATTQTASKSWTRESSFRNTRQQTDGVFYVLFTKQGVERIRHLPHSKYSAYLLGIITTSQPSTDFFGGNGFFHQLLGMVLPELNALIHKNTTARHASESPVG